MKMIDVCNTCYSKLCADYPSAVGLYTHICDVTSLKKRCHIGIYEDPQSEEYQLRLRYLERKGYILTTESCLTKNTILAIAKCQENENTINFCAEKEKHE